VKVYLWGGVLELTLTKQSYQLRIYSRPEK